MKKTYITIGKNTYKLYSGIEGLNKNWLLETEEGHEKNLHYHRQKHLQAL
nr:MAG TPA: hypothetical protein [Caudoviricetes sp.]